MTSPDSLWMELHCRRAVDALSEHVRTIGVEYLERTDLFTIGPDYSVDVERRVRLRWTGEGDLHCIQTDLFSDNHAAREDIHFEVSERGGRAVFALPVLEEWSATLGRFLIVMVPPVPHRGTADLIVKWHWPKFWARLEREGMDHLTISVSRSMRTFKVIMRSHCDLPTFEYAAKPSVNATPYAQDDYRGYTWSFEDPRHSKYVFTCRTARR